MNNSAPCFVVEPSQIRALHRLFKMKFRGWWCLEAALTQVSSEAGVEWVSNREEGLCPDKYGNRGAWKIINSKRYLYWCMKYIGYL